MRAVLALVAFGASRLAASALAAVHPFPSAFKTQTITVNGARIYSGLEVTDRRLCCCTAMVTKRVTKLVLMDAPLPGVGPWDEILRSPLLWHFRFGGPDMERLVKGRERIYLDRFWNEFSADPKHFDEASRQHYAKLYSLPGAMHSGFEQFHAFDQDVIDNKAFLAKGPLPMPVLAIGGEKSFGPMMATVARAAATNVQGAVIPGSGHRLMEEQPQAIVAVILNFLR
jgi:pimeloyl-ACP methyl ester carboxylesterase